eukprot:g2414.t1
MKDLSHTSMNSINHKVKDKHTIDNDNNDIEMERKLDSINKKLELLKQVKRSKNKKAIKKIVSEHLRATRKQRVEHPTQKVKPMKKNNIQHKDKPISLSTSHHQKLSAASPVDKNNTAKSINSATKMMNGGGIINNFINVKQGKIPILLLANNRPEQLVKTFESLLKVRGVSSKQIFMSQDGADKRVKDVADRFNISSEQHKQAPVYGPPWQVGATRIARHYKWSLGNFFNKINTEAPCVIVVEDDLRFSPDFYEYFQAVGPVLDTDKTAWAVSAWNDNGFNYLMGADKHNLFRTIFFPGLGWMMTRKLWKEQLERTWPNQHWDHWLRSRKQHRNREVIYPEFPRVFHAGIKGTFMEKKTHKKYFAQIATNFDPTVHWNKDDAQVQNSISKAFHVNYEKNLVDTITASKALTTLADFNNFDKSKYKAISIWIIASVLDGQNRQFQAISKFFGIWHEHQRASHCGVHEFSWCKPSNPSEKIRVFLINIHSSVQRVDGCNYIDLKSQFFADAPLLDNNFFRPSPITGEIQFKCRPEPKPSHP